MIETLYWTSIIILAVSLLFNIASMILPEDEDKRFISPLAAFLNLTVLYTLWNVGEMAGVR